MKLAAAEAIADLTHESELVPDALDPNVHERVATAVRDAAIEGGAAHMRQGPDRPVRESPKPSPPTHPAPGRQLMTRIVISR